MLRREVYQSADSFRAYAYFQVLTVDIELCSGCEATGGSHMRLSNPLKAQRITELVYTDHEKYGGDINAWFQDFVSLKKPPVSGSKCWRNLEGKTCTGERDDTMDLVASLPVFFVIELGEAITMVSKGKEESVVTGPVPTWNFPGTLLPSTTEHADEIGLVFDLLGVVLLSPSESHFITRYTTTNHQNIFDYDGRKHKGSPVLNTKAEFETDLAGQTHRIPKGYNVHQVVYRLRGGSRAQEYFYRIRAKAFKQYFDIQLSKSIRILPNVSYQGDDFIKDVDRTWRIKSSKTEYVSTIISDEEDSDTSKESESERGRTPSFIYSAAQQALSEGASVEERLTPQPDSVSSSSLSIPDPSFTFRCICGLQGDGHLIYNDDEGIPIQCHECELWSHVACQRDGRAGDLKKNDTFLCDFCDLANLLFGRKKKIRKSSRK